MSAPSGDLHVVDFKTNQIVSAVQPKDYWDDKRHWEIKNNIDTLEFRVFENTDHAATLVQQNLVLKEVRGGRIVPYVITETEKDSKDRSLMVYASGEWIQLAKAGIIEPQKIESKTLKQCMEIALKGMKWKIGKAEHDGAHSMVIEEFTDPLNLLKKIAASFELEIQYRAEVVGSKIVGRYVDMVKRRGRDTRKEVTFGKDLIGIKRIENSQNICTALLGFVKKENGEFITISSINKGIPYLVDDAAYQRWNENGKHKFAFYTPQTDDQNMSPERLLILMKTEMSKIVNASVSYGVDAQNIARVPGLSHEEINEGDTIRIIDEGFTPKLYLEARAIAGDESFKDPTQDNYVFGDYREIVDQNDELRRLYQKILSSLYDKVPQELFDQLNNKVKEQNKDIIDAKDKADQAQKESQTAKDLAETTQKYMEQNMVDIIEQPTAPTENLRDGKTLWIDSSDPENKVQKLWKGGQWQRVTPDTGPLKQSIKEVKEDIETAKTELNQKVQSVEGKAQEIAGQIVDVQKQVNGKVDQTWINTQLKDKADKSGVFTKEEINNGFIGKQIYETDKNGNVKKFQDINTSMDQTNEALRQKAEKSELTKTNDDLTKLQNKTNEIETTASGTKQKLSELETAVENTEISIRNLVPNSAIKQTSSDYGFGLRITTIDLVAGETYILMGNGRVDQQTLDDGKYLVIYIYEPTWKYVSKNFTIKTLTDSTGYTLFTPTWTGKYTVASYLSPTGGNRLGKVTTNWVALYKGNVPMGWSPAPEDQVTTTDFTKKTVEIETTIKGINTSVSSIQSEQGKLTERLTKTEQTADGFKTSIESLTKKDTEISNKLNTVESTVEGTKQTISDVQRTTSELKKTTTEIKEEAGKVTEKLSSVEKKFDDMKFSGRNLLLSTSGTLKSDTGTTISNTDLKSFKFAPDTFEMIRGQEVALSITARTQAFSKGTPSPWMGMELSVTYEDNEQVWLPIRIEDKVAISQGWVRYSAVVTIKNKAVKTGYLNSLIRNVKGMVELKEWQIEIGNKATEYRPAAEDQVTTDEFTKKTTEIEKSVDGVKTTVSTVQKDQGTMQTTLNQVKQATDSNAQTITTLSQTQGKQGEIIQQNTSDITQLNNQIKSKVTDTQMQEYVGRVGSTNLLFNAAFEDRVINSTTGVVTSRKPSISKWSVGPNGSNFTAVPETARNHDGMNSVKLESSGQTVDRNAAFYQSLPVSPNSGDYVLSAWFYTDAVATIDNTAFVMIEFYNGSTWVTNKVVQLVPLLTNGSWKFISVTMPAPASGVTMIRLMVVIGKKGRLWVSQPQLQQGITPSSFMENPKDYANYDQLVGEIGKKVATSDFDSKVSKMETTINQQSNRIDLKAEKNDVYTKTEANGQFGSKALVDSHTSQLSVMSNEINSTVKKGNIISSINQTAEQIQVQANKINLVGYVTAEHLKGDVLEGMNIRTSRQSNDPRWVEIMKSNVRLKEDGLVRSYWGFYTRNDGGVQPSLFLGKDSTDTVGSIAITQVTPNKTDFANAWGTIGMVNEISNNMFKTNATVGFFRDSGGRLELSAGGHVLIDSKGLINVRSDDFLLLRAKRTMRLETTWDNGGTNINMEATKSFNVMAHSQIWLASNEEHFYDNNAGKFYFRNRNKPSDQNSVLIDDDNANADIRLAYIRVRASHVSGYQNSLQVKNYNGTEFRDLECRSLTVNGNFYNKSTKNIKANIRDLPFDPVEKIMALQPRSYNLKTEVEKLYKMREGKEEGEEPFTTKDIVANYGFIAEETDEIFKSEDGKAVNIYGTLAIHIAATQKMHIELKEVKEENKQLKEQVSMLINEVSTLKDLVRKLIDEKPEQP
ncbi:phage tail spike protein [Bacillus paranthracis]|uniref:phage tail spike protein n=2 Tax=Bacillus TaxID=1386 RepID=UPI002407053F|nr:phage tail spike protein [Bacillus paranthracis]MDF9511274.1 phage tail spike protein [Bacillus paranthracis]MDF9669732.1 phage tail spike protein [Bacillus paranthracis]MDG1609282.1 phage tail spike protein [Bacillus paranthracis]